MSIAGADDHPVVPLNSPARRAPGWSWIAVFPLYILLAGAVGAAWTLEAETETAKNTYSSIVTLAQGKQMRPFVGRRLLPDTAVWLSRVPSRAWWERVSNSIDSRPALSRTVRGTLAWHRENDPLLFTATGLIALSVLGFMLCAYATLWTLYESPAWFRHLLVVMMAVALIGGRGTARGWSLYPYDLPQAFLFTGAILCLVRGNWIFAPLLVAAALNKETSILLVIGFVLIWPGSWRVRWIGGALLLMTYGAIRLWIAWRFRTPELQLTYLPALSNLVRIFVYGSWRLPAWLLAMVALRRNWQLFPIPLRRLIFIPVVLLVAAYFKGWVTEHRAYMEAFSLMALLFTQAITTELGQAHLLRTRPSYLNAFGRS